MAQSTLVRSSAAVQAVPPIPIGFRPTLAAFPVPAPSAPSIVLRYGRTSVRVSERVAFRAMDHAYGWANRHPFAATLALVLIVVGGVWIAANDTKPRRVPKRGRRR